MAEVIMLAISLKPPSVNHFWGRTVGRFGKMYIKPEGKAWLDAMGLSLRGQSLLEGLTETEIAKQRYQVEVWVYLGKRAKGDGDNMWKGIMDGLTKSGAIHSDTGTACVDATMRIREQRHLAHTTTYITVRRVTEALAEFEGK